MHGARILVAAVAAALSLQGIVEAEAQSAADFRTREYYAGGFLTPLDFASVYAQGITGQGVMVGVVDSGIDASHPELIDRIAYGWDFNHDVPIRPGENHALGDHGTHVNGIIGAERNGYGMHGVAFGATLVPTLYYDVENYADVDLLAYRNWHYLADLGVPIINNSIGYDNCDKIPGIRCNVTEFTAADAEALWPRTLEAFRYVTERDVLMVMAAGNASQPSTGVIAGIPYLFPEFERNWLAVAALDVMGFLADYSNRCGVSMDWCVSAPGFAWSTIPVDLDPARPYAVMEGTSMAAPVVSGVAALVKEVYPWFTAHDLQQTILTTAIDVGPEGVDPYYGWGIVNPGRAVQGYGMFVETTFLDTRGYDSTFSNDISGSGGLVKLGEGTLSLTGDSVYLGTTFVEEGGLAVQGSITSEVVVERSGTLSGNGEVGPTWIGAGGTIAPGNSVGVLTVAGDYVQQAGGTYEFEFDAGSGDQIRVGGRAFLDGTLAMVALDRDFSLGTEYDLLLADAGITGGFSEIVGPSAFLGGDVAYGPGGATLTLVQSRSFADAAATRNEASVGRALDTLAAGEIQNDFLLLPTLDAASAVLGALSGEINPSAKTVMINDSTLVRDAVFGRLTSAASSPVRSGATLAGIGEATVFAQGFGAWGSISGDGNAAGLDSDTGGFLIGADAELQPAWRLGLLGGYSRTTFESDSAAGSGNTSTVHLALYSGGVVGPVRLRGGAAYGWSSVETARSVVFPEMAGSSASYDATTGQLFGEVGYGIAAGKAELEPFAGLAYVSLNTDGFTEQSGPMALSAESGDTDTGFTTLGLRASSAFDLGTAKAGVKGMLGWRHAFNDIVPTTTYHVVADSAGFEVAGLPVAEDALVLDLGLGVGLAKAARLDVSYSGQYGDGVAAQALKGSLGWSF